MAINASGAAFPRAKLVVLFCVTTGAVLEVAIASFKTSEWEMARQLYARLQSEDVVVADSAYGTYVDLVLVQSAHADALRVRQSPTEGDPPSGLDSPCSFKHHARHCDFRRGKKLGIGDHIVSWQRPRQCPRSMHPTDNESLTRNNPGP